MLFMKYMDKKDIVDTTDATATAEDILKDKTAYVNGEKITGTLEAGGNNAIVRTEVRQGTLTSGVRYSKAYLLIKTIDEDLTLYSGDTTADHMFYNCTYLEKIKSLDISSATSTLYMFYGCINLKEIPELNMSNSTGALNMFYKCETITKVPMLDLSKCQNTQYMFRYCTNLRDVPQFNLGSATIISHMFQECPNLTDESLNNIMASLITATAYTGTKTLATIGLTSDQATRCQSLSNYQAFLDSGWTTGY